MAYIGKKVLTMAGLVALAASTTFAQMELRDAVDNHDVATAQKIVKKGEAEEIYCGELTADEAVKVYDKIFKAMPSESFESCPVQFSYGYGTKVCSNAKEMATCEKVAGKLLEDATAGKATAFKALNDVTKAILKTKAFAKPVKEQVDTTLWVDCPKKGAAMKSCIEECWAQADTLIGADHKPECDKKAEHYISTELTVSKESPLYVALREGILNGFWKAPKTSAESFAKMMQDYGSKLSIPDSAIVNLKYVERWADAHKASSTALPGSELFRFCAVWNDKVDSILVARELDARCPVFETFVDPRDNQSYKVKDINGAKWFVNNLNYEIENMSTCYDGEAENCKTYGRLYTYEGAQTACPEGTHLSTDDDWKMLEVYAGGANSAAEKLRSNGSDDYAFTAMFGGYVNKNNISVTIGEGAYFWTEGSFGDNRGKARSLFSTDREVSTIPVEKTFSLSVRCVVNASAAPAENTIDAAPATESVEAEEAQNE